MKAKHAKGMAKKGRNSVTVLTSRVNLEYGIALVIK
jgi:hypothetical protein